MKSRASHRKRLAPPRTLGARAAANPIDTPALSRNYSRDLLVSGVMGALASTRVRTIGGAALTAVFAEVMVTLLGVTAPGLYPPDPGRTLRHKVIGAALFVGGWFVGRQFQTDDC